jgi:predicted metal-dependent hydrolase
VEDPFARGARLFDAAEYFEAHEAWEELWREATDESERRFLQGLIQVAAAFHKLFAMHSEDAARRLLARGQAKLEACTDVVAERGLARFCHELGAYAAALAMGHGERGNVPKMAAAGASAD